jgi:hypothetical protein
MSEFDRKKVIQILIEDDLFAILDNGDQQYLYDILETGHIGYAKLSDELLIAECYERDISYLISENNDDTFIDINKTNGKW